MSASEKLLEPALEVLLPLSPTKADVVLSAFGVGETGVEPPL